MNYQIFIVNNGFAVLVAAVFSSLPDAIIHADHISKGLGMHAEVWWRQKLQYSTDPQNVSYLSVK